MDPNGQGRMVFRPAALLRVPVALGLLFWCLIAAFLLSVEPFPTRVFLSALFFVVLFLLSLTYYSTLAIAVDELGLTYRSVLTLRTVPWEEVLKADVQRGLFTSYAVYTRGGRFSFSSLFARHGELFRIILERSGLEQRGG